MSEFKFQLKFPEIPVSEFEDQTNFDFSHNSSINITTINIESVIIYEGALVDGIQFTYNVSTKNGAPTPYISNHHGFYGGVKRPPLTLADDEEITGISVHIEQMKTVV